MSGKMENHGILLESGTNEVEIIEFYLGTQSFGINVVKVKQIMQFNQDLLTSVPQAHPFVLGLFLFRDTTIPLIDLRKALDYSNEDKSNEPLVLVTEFNRSTNGFLIDGVNRIHRISWKQLQPLTAFLEGFVSSFTGSINVEGKEILILDLEQIVAEINPEAGFQKELSVAKEQQVSEKGPLSLIIAEDSTFVRNHMTDSLKKAGFNIKGSFDNGELAFEYLKSMKDQAAKENKPVSSYLDIIVTDIEMPKMDGLALCKNIKETLQIKDVPILAFSSLINDQMIEKCKKVGVDSYISKPNVEILRDTINSICSAHAGR